MSHLKLMFGNLGKSKTSVIAVWTLVTVVLSSNQAPVAVFD